jgi:phosphoribosylglycinamide formyltransferase-1
MSITRIAIFASGQGSNALNIVNHFKTNSRFEITFVLANKFDAKVLEHARKENVKTFYFENQKVEDGCFITELCKEYAIDFIVLAGYLRKIPVELIQHYPEKIINIHPALLPKYGGAGMYGNNVHLAVLKNREPETGITIHFVNEEFDSGRIIAQFRCRLNTSDTLEDVQRKIHQLEQSYFPTVIEKTILNLSYD